MDRDGPYEPPNSKTTSKTSYTIYYTVLTFAICFLFYIEDFLDRFFSLSILILPILGLPTLLWVAIMIKDLSMNIFRRNWRRVSSIIIAPVIVGVFFKIILSLGITPDLIHLEYNKSIYLKEVSEIPATYGSPRLKAWNWGSVGGFVATNVFSTLVYDDSDQILLPWKSRTANWNENASKANISMLFDEKGYGKDATVKHLNGHFYLVTTIAQ